MRQKHLGPQNPYSRGSTISPASYNARQTRVEYTWKILP